jgi:hypothetical protein
MNCLFCLIPAEVNDKWSCICASRDRCQFELCLYPNDQSCWHACKVISNLARRIFSKNDKTNVCAWGSNKHRPSSNTTPTLASYEGLFGKKMRRLAFYINKQDVPDKRVMNIRVYDPT